MSVNKYFLGANSAEGFFSCYEHFCRQEFGDFLWVIKGGPGCGKSSFMRKIGKAAEERGFDVEYVLCSGDPDSLDGVYIPQLHLAYTDGTAPHVQEAIYPAVRGAYLNLGQYYDTDALLPYADALISISKEYKSHYQNAYKMLSEHRNRPINVILPQMCKKRFHAAITWRGLIYCDLPYNCVNVTNEALYSRLNENADVELVYLHPLWPQQIVAFLQSNTLFVTDIILPDCGDAIHELQEAKALHDELEAIYNPHVDFDAIYALAQEHIEKYL